MAEIAIVVEYFRNLRPGRKVVLLGHSKPSLVDLHPPY